MYIKPPVFEDEVQKIKQDKEIMGELWRAAVSSERVWCRRCVTHYLTQAEVKYCDDNNLEYLCYNCQRQGIEGLGGTEQNLAMKRSDPRGTRII